jgi:glycosyltransferase involved in cell wall biosynthesis
MTKTYKILMSLTYYKPNISGVTVYAEILAKHLTKNYDLTILTSQFKNNLPAIEKENKINIRRMWSPIRIGKGILMPLFPLVALRQVVKHDLVICHLPQLEAFILLFWAKLLGKPSIIIHHCEFGDAPGLFNKLIKYLTYLPHYFAYLLVDEIIAYTQDYAQYSIFLSRFQQKITYVLPPVVIEKKDKQEIKGLKDKYQLNKQTKVIGFVGRIGWEKGIDLLLNTIPQLKKELNDFKIILVGPYQDVIGDKTYFALEQLIEKYNDRVILTGRVDHENLVNYYHLFDCLVLPSTNNLETFGIVQPEAMLTGCPVVASNLPGVRVPVRKTKMGEITPIGNTKDLGKKIIQVVKHKNKYLQHQPTAHKLFSRKQFNKKWNKIINQNLSS